MTLPDSLAPKRFASAIRKGKFYMYLKKSSNFDLWVKMDKSVTKFASNVTSPFKPTNQNWNKIF